MDRLALLAPDDRDVEHIADNLRHADLQELLAVYGPSLDTRQCLRNAVATSAEVYVAVTAAGEPVALTGVAAVSLLGGLGCPWLLGTDTLMRYPRDIVAQGRRLVLAWGETYPELYNYVDARNTRSIAWLKRIGFTVPPPVPHGFEQVPFHRFERCT